MEQVPVVSSAREGNILRRSISSKFSENQKIFQVFLPNLLQLPFFVRSTVENVHTTCFMWVQTKFATNLHIHT